MDILPKLCDKSMHITILMAEYLDQTVAGPNLICVQYIHCSPWIDEAYLSLLVGRISADPRLYFGLCTQEWRLGVTKT